VLIKLQTWLEVVGSYFSNDVLANVENDDSVIRLGIVGEYQAAYSE